MFVCVCVLSVCPCVCPCVPKGVRVCMSLLVCIHASAPSPPPSYLPLCACVCVCVKPHMSFTNCNCLCVPVEGQETGVSASITQMYSHMMYSTNMDMCSVCVRACVRVCVCVHAPTCIISLALREGILAVYKSVKLLTIMDKPQSFAVCLPVCLRVCPASHAYVRVCVYSCLCLSVRLPVPSSLGSAAALKMSP